MGKYCNITTMEQLDAAIRRVERDIRTQEESIKEGYDGIRQNLKPISAASGFVMKILKLVLLRRLSSRR